MNLLELHFFTGKCLTLDAVPALREPLGRALASGEIPLPDWIRFCDRQFVLPAVYYSLKRHGLLARFPDGLREHLDELWEGSRERNRGILRQIAEINTILGRKHIAPVYLKGAAHLLDGLYEDLGERMMHDIDFLVAEEQYPDAARSLLDAGYTEIPVLPCQRNDPGRATHYPALEHAGHPAVVEIHRSPCHHADDLFTAAAIVDQRQSVAGMENVFVPCDVHQLAHHVIHSQITHAGYRNKSVRWRDLYDYYLLTQRVAPRDALPWIRQKDVAEAYFLYAAQSLGCGSVSYDTGNRAAHRYCRRAKRALRHPRRHRAYLACIKLADLLFCTYFKRILQACFDRSARAHILRRIKDPRWRKQYWQTHKRRVFGGR